MRNKFWAIAIGIGALGATLGIAGKASAGCDITIKVKNTGNATYTVNWDDSKVKVKGGLWKKIGDGKESVSPGAIVSTTYKALFNCGSKRRYQVRTLKGGSEKTTYYPSSSTWTTKQTFTVKVSM